MKEKFLALVEEVKNTGIVKAIYKASNAKELKKLWERFKRENQELISRIQEFELEANFDFDRIFIKGETIENPMEVYCIILCWEYLTEDELFEDKNDFINAIKNIDNNISARIAYLMEYEDMYVWDILPENIFS